MNWKRGHIIGHGSSATVYAATLRSSGEILAVKSAELSRSEPLQREHEILSTLDPHPNVIGYSGCHVTIENNEPTLNLVMEYAAEGTVSGAARAAGGLDEPTTNRYARGIAKGLEHLHSRGVVHCDVKGSNVLLSRGEAKIADFGCARAAAAAAATIGGTPMFMSPEAARGEEQGFPADVWALGCAVIEMATGKPPWPETADTLGRIAFSGEAPEVPGFLSELGKDFLSKCLRVDPGERWTAGQLLEHPFLREVEKRSCSPTSVLDRGIWSSIDQEEITEDIASGSEIGYGGLLERMKELSVGSGEDKWEWGERWITVRDSKTVKIRCNYSGVRLRENREITEDLVLYYY